MAALALAATLAIPAAMNAQVIKAPRYSGANVEAPLPQLTLPPAPPAITPHGEVVENTVVQVNDQVISRSDVERAAEQLEQEAAQNHVPPDQFAEMQKNMLRDMIDQQLLLSRAKELGLNADADVIRQLDDIRKRNNLASLDDLEKAVRAQGLNYEDFKAQIRNQILTQQVVRDEVGRHLQMSQGEEQKYYDEHKSEFEQPEQVKLSEILVPLPDNASAEQIAQAEAKANDIKSQIMKGGDFAELAKKYSGGPSAQQGGDLGAFKRGALAKVLEDQTFSLKPGESTQPIRTRQGFVILKVNQHQQAGPAPLKDVEQQVQEAMYMQQMQPALRAYLSKLRNEAYIDIQPGFSDSGATGTESKLINTAYAPPAPRKKKPAQTTRFEGNSRGAAKAPVVSSPDTTGGRTLTGSDAEIKPATTTAQLDQNTGLAVLKPTKVVNGKIVKVKKEKVRFGQAPRNSLPGSDDGTQTGVQTAVLGAPATPSVPPTVAANESANLADNPLNAAEPARTKTRFAARAVEEKQKKATTLSARKKEKILAKPVAATAEESATEKIQSAPLSAAGNDEAKKQPKPKKQKGQVKQRLEDKPAVAAPTTPTVAPTANPSLAPTDQTPPSTKAKPAADQTTLPGVGNPPPNAPTTTIPPPNTTPTTTPPPDFQ
jgi:peptidyl-prolyl cis-trans isomerase SurA